MADGDALDSVASELNLSSDSVATLRKFVGWLHEFETTGKASMLTRSAREKQFSAIADHAKNLRDAIDALGTADLAHLGGYLPAVQRPIADAEVQGGAAIELYPQLVEAMTVISNLWGAAMIVAAAEFDDGKSGGKGGRKEVLPIYAEFVWLIALALKSEPITSGRGGNFQKVCDAVWKCAGVPATSEGAVRKYRSFDVEGGTVE